MMKWWKYAKFITLVLNVVKICWFQVLGVVRGLWQFKMPDNELLRCLGILKRIIWDSMVFGDSSKDFMGFCGLWETRILLHSECVKLFQPIERMLDPNDSSFFSLKVYELGVKLKEKTSDEINMPIGNLIV